MLLQEITQAADTVRTAAKLQRVSISCHHHEIYFRGTNARSTTLHTSCDNRDTSSQYTASNADSGCDYRNAIPDIAVSRLDSKLNSVGGLGRGEDVARSENWFGSGKDRGGEDSEDWKCEAHDGGLGRPGG
jgi:hypothetical protein